MREMHPLDDYDDGPVWRPRPVSYRHRFRWESWGTLAWLAVLLPLQASGWLDSPFPTFPELPAPVWWLIGVLAISAAVPCPLYYVRGRLGDRCTALICNATK